MLRRFCFGGICFGTQLMCCQESAEACLQKRPPEPRGASVQEPGIQSILFLSFTLLTAIVMQQQLPRVTMQRTQSCTNIKYEWRWSVNGCNYCQYFITLHVINGPYVVKLMSQYQGKNCMKQGDTILIFLCHIILLLKTGRQLLIFLHYHIFANIMESFFSVLLLNLFLYKSKKSYINTLSTFYINYFFGIS